MRDETDKDMDLREDDRNVEIDDSPVPDPESPAKEHAEDDPEAD